MSLTDTADQLAFGESIRALLQAEAPISAVRTVMDEGLGFDEKLWRRLSELGVAGVLVPEEYGGAGAGLADLAPVLRELARHLVPFPLIPSSVLAVTALLRLGDVDVMSQLLPGLASGEVVATLATSEPGSTEWLPRSPATTATTDLRGTTLTGTKRAVLCAAEADVVLVVASSEDGDGLYLVAADALGLLLTREEGIDPLRASCSVRMEGTPATLVRGDVHAALASVADLADVALAVGQAAAMRRTIELTTEYARLRYSFGQPIGSYQGVKHRLADLYTDWCLADAAARRAVESHDAGESDAGACARAARLLVGPAFIQASKQMMMLHGGIGFTWEHDAHLFHKKAIADASLLGGTTGARRRLVQSVAAAVVA